jgi:hypothetical protein
MGERHAFKADS